MMDVRVPVRDKNKPCLCVLSGADHIVQSACIFVQIAFFEATGRSRKFP